MKMKMIIIVVLLNILFYSCEDVVPPLSPEQQILENRAALLLSMDDENFDLTISVTKFAKASYIKFSVVYNYDKYDINNYTVGGATLDWTNLDNDNLNHDKAEFIFSLFLPPVIIILPLLKTAIVIFLQVLSLPLPLQGLSQSQIPKLFLIGL